MIIWNVQGLTKAKIDNPIFLSYLFKYDIILLSETTKRPDSDFDITGYVAYAAHRSNISRAARRASCGIIACISDRLSHAVTILKKGPGETLWLKSNDVILCLCYIQPLNAPSQSNNDADVSDLITPTQVMVYHWWIPCVTLVHTGSR